MVILVVFKDSRSTSNKTGVHSIPGGSTTKFQITEVDADNGVVDISGF